MLVEKQKATCYSGFMTTPYVDLSPIIPKTKKKHKSRGFGRKFLLTFFDPDTAYQEIEMNGFRLTKVPDGNKGKYKVKVYPLELETPCIELSHTTGG